MLVPLGEIVCKEGTTYAQIRKAMGALKDPEAYLTLIPAAPDNFEFVELDISVVSGEPVIAEYLSSNMQIRSRHVFKKLRICLMKNLINLFTIFQ